MGLDMYLFKYQKIAGVPLIAQVSMDPDNMPEEIKKAFAPYIKEKGTNFKWLAFNEDVMYWRKANAIHKFFVDKVQKGVDNCGDYEVSIDIIKELHDLCVQAKDIVINSHKKNIKVHVGFSHEEGALYEDREVYDVDEYIINDVLPTQSGFFFGNTAYDEGYLNDLNNTIEACVKIINEFDFENNDLVYTSSW